MRGSRIITRPRGLVTSGLVAHYPFGSADGDRKRNLLRWSEAFSNAAWVGTAGVTVTLNKIDPNGGLTASLISFAADGDRFEQVVTRTVAVGESYTDAIWVRNPTGTVIFRCSRGGAGTFEGTEMNVPAGATWTQIKLAHTFANPQTGVRLDIRASGGAASVEIAFAQLNEGTTPLQYERTTDNQLLFDRSPFANHGQLGSTSGADTNDPYYTNQGGVCGADDFFLVPAAAQINNLDRITCMFAGRLDGWGGGNLGRIGDKASRIFYVSNARLNYTQSFTGAGAVNGWWQSVGGSLSLNPLTAAVTYDRSNVATSPIFYIGGRVSATSVVTTPVGTAASDAASDLYLGNNSSANRNLDGLLGYYLEYNRILSPAEIARNHQYLRGIMARRGLVIAA